MITVSEKALQHVVNLMMESNITPDSHHLRVGVKGGGCSGLSYVMDFDNKIKDTDGFLYRVIVGSSKFNIEEMTRLIETVLRYCVEHNIETEVLRYE